MKAGELAAELTKFGVTKQEADLFLLLSRVRNASPKGVTGSELAKLGVMGRVRTYQLLDSLVDLGIVQVEVGRPKRYLAENPQTAVRRLVALQEQKLNDLSLAEEAIAEELANAPALLVQKERPDNEAGSKVAVLHGIPTIQSLLRRAIQDKDLRVVVNEESEDHIFTTVRYLTRKPKSAKVVYATEEEKQTPFEGERVEIDGYKYRIRVFKGDLPTMVMNREQCLLLFYETQRYRPKPLSPVTVRTVVSSCVVIEGAKQVGRLETNFQNLWDHAR